MKVNTLIVRLVSITVEYLSFTKGELSLHCCAVFWKNMCVLVWSSCYGVEWNQLTYHACVIHIIVLRSSKLYIAHRIAFSALLSFSALTRFGGRKGIRPVKTEWWGAGVVICLELCADLHMAQLMPLPLAVSCFSKIQIGFTFLVPAQLGSPVQRAIKRVCVLLNWYSSAFSGSSGIVYCHYAIF